jgi:hypothetical protein
MPFLARPFAGKAIAIIEEEVNLRVQQIRNENSARLNGEK